MNHFTSPEFWKHYDDLPKPIQAKADRQFQMLAANPRHPSLQFKPVGPYWSARVDISYREVAVRSDNDYIWFWIVTHDDYDKLIS